MRVTFSASERLRRERGGNPVLMPSQADEYAPTHGLVNSSDVVGRHYMGHVNSVLMAVSTCPNSTIFQKTRHHFYFRSDEWEYPIGHISFVGKLDGPTRSSGSPAIAPAFTLKMMAQRSLDFWLTTEDLPDPNNRVTLDKRRSFSPLLHDRACREHA